MSILSDPLASPTMALLYTRQGHYGRANKTINALLEKNPDNGAAMVVRDRIDAQKPGTLSLQIDKPTLRLKWSLNPNRLDLNELHLVLTVWSNRNLGFAPWVTSFKCSTHKPNLTFRLPKGKGSAAACIAKIERDGRFVPIIVAPASSW